MTMHGATPVVDQIPGKRRFAWPRLPHVSLTARLIVLVLIAVFPAIVIQAYNEYELRKASEAAIRQQVVQITKQFGEEIGELREGARQLLLALTQLTPVKLRESEACSALFATLGSQYANYSLLAAADTDGRIFCSSVPLAYSSVADQPIFKRAMAQDGLAVGNYWADPASDRRMIHFALKFGDGDSHTAGVVFAGQQRADLELVDLLAERGEIAGGLFAGRLVVLTLGQFEHHPGVVEAAPQAVQPAQFPLQVGEPAGDRLGLLLIVPEPGVGGACPQVVSFTPHGLGVEDGLHAGKRRRQFREFICGIGTCHAGKPTRARAFERTIARQLTQDVREAHLL